MSDVQSQDLIGEAVGGEVEPEGALPPSGMRNSAYRLLLWGIKNGGAAFIKWGQWSATREDMFPPELCHVLAELHDQAPTHSWR
jgi:predicted unusual protein kinase regulating ubiquinone biosynthesis (AarF/ABC1/UbiB family)